MFVHLPPSITFNSNVVDSLILYLFNVFTWFSFPPLPSSHFRRVVADDFALAS